VRRRQRVLGVIRSTARLKCPESTAQRLIPMTRDRPPPSTARANFLRTPPRRCHRGRPWWSFRTLAAIASIVSGRVTIPGLFLPCQSPEPPPPIAFVAPADQIATLKSLQSAVSELGCRCTMSASCLAGILENADDPNYQALRARDGDFSTVCSANARTNCMNSQERSDDLAPPSEWYDIRPDY
jgi:hypothetical protein